MDKKFTVFGFLAQVFMIYGITTGLLNIFCMLFGREAEGYSTMFSLAGAGVSVATSLQFLLALTVVMILRMVFMSDMLIKNMPLGARIAAMFVSVFAVVVACVLLFGWFPINEAGAWIGFIASFAICTAVSAFFMRLEERAENKKMQEALNRLKK